MFEDVLGQDNVKKYFARSFDSDTMPHSILLSGPPGTGKTAIAIELARILTCHGEERKPCGECISCSKFVKMEHPDVLFFFPVTGSIQKEKKEEEIRNTRAVLARNPYSKLVTEKNASLNIEMVRTIKQNLRLQSYQGRGRVVILIGCDTLNQETGNALLKILEEPPDKTTIILTTSNIENVLPTIKSRCRQINTSYLTEDLIIRGLATSQNLPEKDAAYLARLSGGSYSLALDFLSEDFAERKEFCGSLLDQVISGSKLENIEFTEEWIGRKPKITDIKGVFDLFVAILKIRYENMLIRGNGSTEFAAGETDGGSVEKLTPQLIEAVVLEIENSIDLLNKNVYLNMILMILILRLRKLFQYE